MGSMGMVRRIIYHLKAPQSFREIVSDVVLLFLSLKFYITSNEKDFSLRSK